MCLAYLCLALCRGWHCVHTPECLTNAMCSSLPPCIILQALLRKYVPLGVVILVVLLVLWARAKFYS